MFTSRAEHRLLLSQNNAEQRLLTKAYENNLISKDRMEDYKNNEEKYSQFINSELKKTKTKNFLDNNKKEVILKEKKSLYELLSRPDTNQEELYQPTSENKKHYQRACVEIRYAGYIKKQKERSKKTKNKT